MAEKTEIAWCDATFNPWIGCQKVSAGCDNCYAETQNKFRKWNGGEWGPHAPRKRTSAQNWRGPLAWNVHHDEFFAQHGRRRRVFCSSLADVFDNQAPVGARDDLWALIAETPKLDWLLLTKRPENIRKMLPALWPDKFQNVWLGVTAEDQAAYDRRWPILRDIPAAVRFISYEPAIGPLWVLGEDQHSIMPHWLICGGESGAGYRDMPTSWVSDIGWICRANGVAFFFKQMAGKKPIPDQLLVREFPVVA